MAKEIILSKESSESEIKAYFNAVLKLSQSDNEFPINFDEVWMLVYQDKHKAVNELKDKFIEDVDYQAVTQKVKCQNGIGSSRRIDYYLTVSCMEFFIARKVRPVFEVYRKVFHRNVQKAIEDKQTTQPTISDKMKVATWLIKTLNLDEHSKLVIAKSIADPLGLPTPEYVEDEVMLPISKILSRKGISISPQKANKKLLEIGLLEQVERYSKRKGRNEQKYIISEKGKTFGKMHQFKDASFPSPAWFVDKSDDLINLLTNTTTGGLTYGK